jgi:hypothetical protein
LAISVVDERHQALLEFVFRSNADMAEDRAGQLGKEALDQIEPRAMGRRESEGEAPRRLRRKPSRGLARDVRRMVVEDEFYGGIGRICGVEELEQFDEFAAAVALLDQRVDLTGQQIDARHQGEGAVALVFMIAHHGGGAVGPRRQIRHRRAERLDARLLVIGDDGRAPVHVRPGARRALPVLAQQRHLPVDARRRTGS